MSNSANEGASPQALAEAPVVTPTGMDDEDGLDLEALMQTMEQSQQVEQVQEEEAPESPMIMMEESSNNNDLLMLNQSNGEMTTTTTRKNLCGNKEKVRLFLVLFGCFRLLRISFHFVYVSNSTTHSFSIKLL